MDTTFLSSNLWIIVILVAWELAWKGLALWKAARHQERYWFVALLFINTLGILPILYLMMNYNKKRQQNIFLHHIK